MSQKWNLATYNMIVEKTKKIIEEDIIEFIYEKMREMIYSTVYNAYSPTEYKRRFDTKGGLGDISTYSYEIITTDNGFDLRVFTNSEANGDNEPEALDKYIVEGKYTWKDSRIYKEGLKRDFYEATLEDLLIKGTLYDIVRRKFAEQGIKVK